MQGKLSKPQESVLLELRNGPRHYVEYYGPVRVLLRKRLIEHDAYGKLMLTSDGGLVADALAEIDAKEKS